MTRNALIPLIVLLLLLVSHGQAMDKEDLVPSTGEIQSLFDPYSCTPFGDHQISQDSIDIAYTYYQSKKYNPPREGVRIFFRITVFNFEPAAHDSEVAAIQQTIDDSQGDPSSGYGKRELIDIGEIGYYQDIYDSYAGGPPIGCEIGYITGNYSVWCAYNRKVDPEGYETHFEDPSEYIQRCVQILKAPEGPPETIDIVKTPSLMLYPEILTDASEYQPGDPFSLTIQVSDQDGRAIADINGTIIFSSGSDTPIPAASFTTDSKGTGVITGIWPQMSSGRIWIRVEVEKEGYQPGSNEISVSLQSKSESDNLLLENGEEHPEDQLQTSKVHIQLMRVIQESNQVIVGSIQIEKDGEYIQWHPQTARSCTITVVVRDESGDLITIVMTAPVESDGTFQITHIDQYLKDTNLLWDSISTKGDIVISDGAK